MITKVRYTTPLNNTDWPGVQVIIDHPTLVGNRCSFGLSLRKNSRLERTRSAQKLDTNSAHYPQIKTPYGVISTIVAVLGIKGTTWVIGHLINGCLSHSCLWLMPCHSLLIRLLRDRFSSHFLCCHGCPFVQNQKVTKVYHSLSGKDILRNFADFLRIIPNF